MKVLPWVLLILALVGGNLLFGWSTQREYVLRQQLDSIQRIGRGLDTVYLRQTDTMRVVRFKTDSILRTDTVIHTDTVRQIVEAERRACDAVLNTCEQQKQNLRSQIGNLQEQIKKSKPSRFGCVVGGGAVTKGFDAGVLCGVRIF